MRVIQYYTSFFNWFCISSNSILQDIDIITERKDGSKPEPPAQPSRHITIKNPPARTASADHGQKTPALVPRADTPTKAQPPQLKSGADYPPVRTSTIDLDAKPIYEPTGKPITAIDLDAGKPTPLPHSTPRLTLTAFPSQTSPKTTNPGAVPAPT